MSRYTIELDCPPGGIRPGDLISDVIKGTGLPTSDPVSKVFGNWTWVYDGVEGIDNLWPRIKPLLQHRIESLYERGLIRYGSW